MQINWTRYAKQVWPESCATMETPWTPFSCGRWKLLGKRIRGNGAQKFRVSIWAIGRTSNKKNKISFKKEKKCINKHESCVLQTALHCTFLILFCSFIIHGPSVFNIFIWLWYEIIALAFLVGWRRARPGVLQAILWCGWFSRCRPSVKTVPLLVFKIVLFFLNFILVRTFTLPRLLMFPCCFYCSPCLFSVGKGWGPLRWRCCWLSFDFELGGPRRRWETWANVEVSGNSGRVVVRSAGLGL